MEVARYNKKVHDHLSKMKEGCGRSTRTTEGGPVPILWNQGYQYFTNSKLVSLI